MAVSLDYVSKRDLFDVISEKQVATATDDDSFGDDAKQDTLMVKRFLKRAESVAEMYLSRYDLPIQNAPHSLKYAILIIARYMLLERGDAEASDEVVQSYNDVIGWLRSISEGEVELGRTDENVQEDAVGERTGEFQMPFNDKASFRDKF